MNIGTVPNWYRTPMKTAALTLALVATFAACSSPRESGKPEQTCGLIASGADAEQIYTELDDIYGTGSTFAEHLYEWIQTGCPVVLDDPAWRDYFAVNNLGG